MKEKLSLEVMKMGRLPKKGVDYFSHDVTAAGSPTLFTVQQKFGNDGYALWFKLLEHLGTKDTLSMDISNVSDWQYFIAKSRVTEEQAKEILDLLASINAIDPKLWSVGIIWSDNFAERLADVYKKRGTETPSKPDFCDRNDSTTDVSVAESTQSKVKESKEKKSKKNTDVEKVSFAEFVRMTQKEYDTLVERFGEPATLKCIEVLDNYKGSKKKHYDSDYRAILSWVVDKVKEKNPGLFKKTVTNSPSDNPFASFG